jgi:hypothetical protein
VEVSDSDFNLILACLRLQSRLYEEKSAIEGKAGNHRQAMQFSQFAFQCGALSDRLDAQRPRRIIRPN